MSRTVAGCQLAIQRVHSRLQADVPAPVVVHRYMKSLVVLLHGNGNVPEGRVKVHMSAGYIHQGDRKLVSWLCTSVFRPAAHLSVQHMQLRLQVA
jgi:hypothetical protein